MESSVSGIQYTVPIKVLSTKTVNRICEALNTLMILPAENGLLRDWRGLSELLQIEVSMLERHPNPTQKLFELAAQSEETNNVVGVLISCLQALDRFDVIDDNQKYIDNDILQYASIEIAIQADAPQMHQDESYDAMVLYAENDVDFAYNLVDIMEKNYSMKLFVKDRNLKAGDKEVQKTLSVIAEKSNKLIVVLSPGFLTSPMNEFFLDYAQTIAIEQQVRKIIPCMLTPCQLPQQLLGLHTLIYTTNNHWGNFWNRLAMSINQGALMKQHTQDSTRILQSTLTSTKQAAEISGEPKQLYSSLQPEMCPTVSNSQCNIMTPSLIANALASSSRHTEHGSSKNKSKSTLCNDADTETALSKKSSSKKVSAFLTKLIPKKSKKSSSKKTKEKIAIAL